ncbi:MAG TPA: RsmD family RNA methyltransferase [Candidatus Saccharimonadales bacterium]|nr:RsmD family RNA methyltransferase [Candidatus Saccharimonadales bacterium]
MRVITGTLGNRRFDAPGTFKTHPMSDKARGALFNILGDIEGLSVLDPFAGSGALSFEAISRGAGPVVAIELDRTAQKIITANIADLDIADQITFVKASANGWLSTNPDAQFDLVLCDPPYDDMQPGLLAQLAGRVVAGGIFVLSLPKDTALPELPELELVEQRTYSRATLAFFRKNS